MPQLSILPPPAESVVLMCSGLQLTVAGLYRPPVARLDCGRPVALPWILPCVQSKKPVRLPNYTSFQYDRRGGAGGGIVFLISKTLEQMELAATSKGPGLEAATLILQGTLNA